MINLVLFDFEGSPVRVVDIDGVPWFVGKDVAERLGYADPNHAMKRHCKGVAKRHPLQTAGGMQEVRILSEPDVLRLIMGSKLPSAERFERWVFEEVLPAIRKTGRYVAPGFRAVDETGPLAAAAAANLTTRELNAWWRHLEGLSSLFGKRVAAAHYPSTPLPPVDARSLPSQRVSTPEIDGEACLAHLLAVRVRRSDLTVGDLVRLARYDAHTNHQLGAMGILVDPTNLKG